MALTLRALGGLSPPGDRPGVPGRERGDHEAQGSPGPGPRSVTAGIPFAMEPDAEAAARPARRRPRRALPDLGPGYGATAGSTSPPRRSGWPGTLGRSAADQPRVTALLALMLLHDSRRDARWAGGELRPARRSGPRPVGVAGKIAEGRRLCSTRRCAVGRRRTPAPVQAAIAALQTEDPIDWAAGGGALRPPAGSAETGSAVVALNRAVAVAEAEGPGQGTGPRRHPRPGGLPLLPLHPSRTAAQARSHRGGPRGLSACARAHAGRPRTAVSRATARRTLRGPRER